MSLSTNPPVPLYPNAIEMTTDWRNYYGEITGTDPNDAFRGFWIPLEDLQAMVDLARQDPSLNITSVRAYLALGESVGNGQTVDPTKVHVLLVPVTGASAGKPGFDVLEVSGASTIRDFTSPCPAMCDITSPLYINPDQEG